jgi:hypothetical protein
MFRRSFFQAALAAVAAWFSGRAVAAAATTTLPLAAVQEQTYTYNLHPPHLGLTT